jgi:hypothetical protein
MPEGFWSKNLESKLHPLYRYAFITDAEEGLIVVDVMPLADGEPRNNFLKRALTWNPDGVLDGAVNLTIAGTRAYVCTAKGLVIVALDDPLAPTVVATLPLAKPRAVAVQFRYAFVVDEEGLKVVDTTFWDKPVLKATVPLAGALDLTVARTYAYFAAGPRGLAIVDVERPSAPGAPKFYDLKEQLTDTRAVRIASTNASLFAYVADGVHGLRVLQLTSPGMTPGHYGFSPTPTPVLIATYETHGPALALSKPLDRDRAVDETGNQIAIFGRLGSRPFNYEELRRMFVRKGKVWTVSDEAK